MYLVEIVAGSEVVAVFDVTATACVWTEDQQFEVLPEGLPGDLGVRVRQGSATYGWGEPAEIEL